MTANEFQEHFVRWLQAKRDFPQLNHGGHFDEAIKSRAQTLTGKWRTKIYHGLIIDDLVRLEAFSYCQQEMQAIERDFNRRA